MENRNWMFALTFSITTFFLLIDVSPNYAQQRQNNEQPFVGFQSFDGRRIPIGPSSSETGRTSSNSNQNYGYPGSRTRSGAPIQTRVTSQMTRSEVATGGLDNQGRATAALIPQGRVIRSAMPSQRTFRETSTAANSAPRVASSPQSGWTRSQSTPTFASQRTQTSTNNTVRSRQTARINQAVVQQTSSTMPLRSNTSEGDRTTVARPTTANANQTRVARAPQNCVCVPAQPPVPYRAYQAAANQTPTLTVPNSAAGNYQFQPGLGVPQIGSGNLLTPFVRGSGVYTPLIPLQSMPQGAYLGQGIIGQPTAYVDGQPLRNLLRYISP